MRCPAVQKYELSEIVTLSSSSSSSFNFNDIQTRQYNMQEMRRDVSKGQNPLHQFPRSKSVTSWRGQKSVVSFVVSQIPLQRLVAILLLNCWHANKSVTSWQFPRLRGSYEETCVMDFGLKEGHELIEKGRQGVQQLEATRGYGVGRWGEAIHLPREFWIFGHYSACRN